MDLYEYQAKELFAAHGVPVGPGQRVVADAEAVGAAAAEFGVPVVIKAQVKVGGRGKVGGVKVAGDPADAAVAAAAILGLDIKGHAVRRVLVTPASKIVEEYYFSFLLDRTNRTFLAMASAEGGVEIEQLAVEGRKHTARMLAAGSTVVGGVTPGKGGQVVEIGGLTLPVFDSVGEAMDITGADVTVVFVPPKFAKGAVVEAIDAGIDLAVVITEGIPVHDTASFWAHACATGNNTRIIGPNCPGVISPGRSNAGIIPADITGPGRIGLVSKSGTLTYQLMYELRDIGFSTAVGIGGDPIIGTTHIDALAGREDHGARRRHRVRLVRHRGRQEGGAGSGRSESRQDSFGDR